VHLLEHIQSNHFALLASTLQYYLVKRAVSDIGLYIENIPYYAGYIVATGYHVGGVNIP
jgi:hypothetical protein